MESKEAYDKNKEGRNNCYIPIVKEEDYLRQESGSILKRLYGSSVKKFVASLYDGEGLSEDQIQELKEYLEHL